MKKYSENVQQHIMSEADGCGLYVGTYKKYNEGSIFGAWLDLATFDDADEFFDVCRELHEDEDDPEFMFQDYQGFPEALYSESMNEDDIEKIIEYAQMDDDDRDILEGYIDATGDDGATLDKARDRYVGHYDDFEDFAEELFFDIYDVPENIRYYIDIAAFARGLKMDYYVADNGNIYSAA